MHINYEDSLSPAFEMLRDLANSSEKLVGIYNYEVEGYFYIMERNMVPVQLALPFVLEFGETGKIDVSEGNWETIMHYD